MNKLNPLNALKKRISFLKELSNRFLKKQAIETDSLVSPSLSLKNTFFISATLKTIKRKRVVNCKSSHLTAK